MCSIMNPCNLLLSIQDDTVHVAELDENAGPGDLVDGNRKLLMFSIILVSSCNYFFCFDYLKNKTCHILLSLRLGVSKMGFRFVRSL